MKHDSTETLLRFTGNWPVGPVLGAACGLALLMFFYYRRELRMHTGPSRWVPAVLRALAVLILVLALAGPILRHVTTFRQLGRVVLAVDASASMSFTDDTLSLNKKGATPAPEPAAPTETSRRSQSRFALVEKALLDPTNSLVRKISQKHDVELTLLRGSKPLRLWWRREDGADTSGDLPAGFGISADGTITNLDEPLREALGSELAGAALVLFSDGQHNAPGSPEELASTLRSSGVPIFTIGCGSEIPPPDLSLLSVAAPEAVFSGDRAEGTLVLSDTLPPNLRAEASISYQNRVLWHQEFITTGTGERRFDFGFPAQELAKTAADGAQTLRLLSVRAELTGADSVRDQLPDNNRRTLALHLLSRKRRVLILDGRPRWETRYLKNHFDRDERWKVTAAFDDVAFGLAGEVEKAFPKTREDLMSYDLIVLGDLRADSITPEQQAMIEEFIGARGGGLILVDGRRNHLREWQRTKAAALLPVTWTDSPAPVSRETFGLTEDGQRQAALRMSDSASVNLVQWSKLPGVYWCASAHPQADATVLAGLADLTGSGSKVSVVRQGLFGPYRDLAESYRPAIVWRRYGAGSVLWLATDEFWRWRYEVADQHHNRFWMQIASWIAAPPFLVEDKHVSIGTDKLRYQEGDTAELRVRLRNDKGGIVTDAQPRVHVLRNGLEVATLEMEPDATHGGVFRAVTGELAPGDYRVTVSAGNLSGNEDARLDFRVESLATQEWSQLNMNRPLLESMAQRSGGRFLHLSDVSQLPDLLQTLDREETRVSETLLWSSWWWFGSIITLLTAEWLLRKKWRLV